MNRGTIGGNGQGSTVWLASYPKSGNTWVRALLAAVLEGRRLGEGSVVGRHQPGGPSFLHEVLGISGSTMTRTELAPLRRLAGALITSDVTEPVIRKVHDAYVPDGDGVPLPLAPGENRAIYVVRDPRDVVTSYAHHFGVEQAEAVRVMRNGSFGDVRTLDPFAYVLTEWSTHVESWCDQRDMPVLVLRYEDLHTDPCGALRRVLELIGVARTDDEIARAVGECEFTRLALDEVVTGFTEAPAPDRVFFRRGQAGAWRDELSTGLVEQVERDHARVMHRFGYLPTGTDDQPGGH